MNLQNFDSVAFGVSLGVLFVVEIILWFWKKSHKGNVPTVILMCCICAGFATAAWLLRDRLSHSYLYRPSTSRSTKKTSPKAQPRNSSQVSSNPTPTQRKEPAPVQRKEPKPEVVKNIPEKAPSVDSSIPMSILGTKINFRRYPNTNSEVLLQLDEGEPVDVIRRSSQEDGMWLHVRLANEKEGWIAGEYVQDRIGTRGKHGGEFKAIKGTDVNIRSKPNRKSDSVGKVNDGNLVELVGSRKQKDGVWYQIYTLTGKTGWILGKYTRNPTIQSAKPVSFSPKNENNIYTFNGHRYQVFNRDMNWDAAKRYCDALGGHLVTIDSEKEQKFLEQLLQTDGIKNSYWLGGYKNSKKEWVWVTGIRMNYTNWAQGQPDNWTKRENKLMCYRNSNIPGVSRLGTWNDIQSDGECNGESFFGSKNFGLICEWDKQ